MARIVRVVGRTAPGALALVVVIVVLAGTGLLTRSQIVAPIVTPAHAAADPVTAPAEYFPSRFAQQGLAGAPHVEAF